MLDALEERMLVHMEELAAERAALTRWLKP